MPLFDVFIVQNNCVTSIDAVKAHPSVKRVIALPRDWLLYEYHDQLFQDPDYLVEGVWERKMQDRPEIRAERIGMLAEQRSLLAPWYKAENKRGDADLIAVSEICDYRIYSLNPLRIVEFEPSNGWGAATAFTITLEGWTTQESDLLQLLDEWELASKNFVVASRSLNSGIGEFILEVNCREYGGHWIVALWALMCDGRYMPGVSKLSVTLAS